DVKLPTPAEKEGYTFKGWEGQTTGIKADGTVNSKYEIKKFTVTVDGVAQTVEYGKDVKLPTPAEKEGYTFKGWEGQTTGIKADGTVNSKYEIKKFTVTVDGVAQTVEYGKDVKLPTPAEKEGYTFKGWEGQTTGIKADG
ncbi:InlB B-repeat-containing protein, partial [Clostridium sp. HCP1S3_A12]|uniref:InlB B-repeat-containing protein n=1 Tax=Clostridium sp. HCP1S3_A12 TaxID=3438917 RepID=UPI003F8BD88D